VHTVVLLNYKMMMTVLLLRGGKCDDGTRCDRGERLCKHTNASPSRPSKKGKNSPYSVTERRVPELIPVLGSQPAGDVSHKPGGRLPLLSARPAVTPATLKRAATNFAAW